MIFKVVLLLLLALFAGAILHVLHHIKEILMATKDDVNQGLDDLAAEAESANTKADTLIALVSTLNQEILDLKAAGGATATDLDGMLVKIKTTRDSLKAQEVQDDAAVPAAAPVSPAPGP